MRNSAGACSEADRDRDAGQDQEGPRIGAMSGRNDATAQSPVTARPPRPRSRPGCCRRVAASGCGPGDVVGVRRVQAEIAELHAHPASAVATANSPRPSGRGSGHEHAGRDPARAGRRAWRRSPPPSRRSRRRKPAARTPPRDHKKQGKPRDPGNLSCDGEGAGDMPFKIAFVTS